jgi:hypothetical protein
LHLSLLFCTDIRGETRREVREIYRAIEG